jgi:hypothetical protein
MMRNSLAAALLALTILEAAAATHHGVKKSGPEAGKEITVKGELVDMNCFMAHNGEGKDHAQCARQCIRGGAPLGLSTPDGKVYLLVEDHSSFKTKRPYSQARRLVTETVTIKGTAYQRGGVKTIVVDAVEQ